MRRGQLVLAGERLGIMSRAPARASADNQPVLYVEKRRDRRRIDLGPDIAGP